MFTNQEVQGFLKLPKKVEQNGKIEDTINLDSLFPFIVKYTLISINNSDMIFLYDVNQSKKNHFKLTLYLMSDETKVGLLRIDYCGQHKNPESIRENVPIEFHPFVGKFFDYNEPHIHYYVEGYKTTLDWALPLTNDDFPIKKISSQKDIRDAFINFNSLINLKTEFNIPPMLL